MSQADRAKNKRCSCAPHSIDTHLHIGREENPQALFDAAIEREISEFIVVGTNTESSEQALSVAATREYVHATVGLHPHEADSFDNDLTPYRTLIRRFNPVAIGEIGLDYYYDNAAREAQRNAFRSFLKLAAQTDLPAVVHCRDAYQDCLQILRDCLQPGQRFEIHSFSGDPQWIAPFQELGAFFSFNGLITFKKTDNVRAALKAVPLERLLFETDTPYLAPEPYRGHPNQPAYLYEIIQRAATELNIPCAELTRITTSNAQRFFNLTC